MVHTGCETKRGGKGRTEKGEVRREKNRTELLVYKERGERLGTTNGGGPIKE